MMTLEHEAPVEELSRNWVPRATRYEPCLNEASLTWRESRPGRVDSGEVPPEPSTDAGAKRTFALLLDISQSGASVALDRVPMAGGDVWLRFGGEGASNWNRAKVVGVSTTAQGPHLVRLAFRNPCPFESLVEVICG